MQINSTAFGLATGILWALGCFILGLLGTYMGYGKEIVDLLGTVYLGVENTLTGSLLALPWAFVDGFIGGFLLAWLYNRFAD